MDKEIETILESMNADERAILPNLKEETLTKIAEKSNIDKTRANRAIQFLTNKKIITTQSSERQIVDLSVNGIQYKKTGLPERVLLNILSEKKTLHLAELEKYTKLSDNEIKAAIGALKKKAMINLANERIMINANMNEVIKKSLEEQFLELLPLDIENLKPEQKFALESLKKRKDIIEIKSEKEVTVKLTELGKKIISADLEKYKNMIEALTTEILVSDSWKGKKFRKYDIKSKVPDINGGKRHYVNQAIDYARKVWTDLGFKEMTGNLAQTGFWNFDALFTAQDHPVREMQDTFFIQDIEGKLPDKSIVKSIKQAHEEGINGSKGWGYSWKEEDAKKIILRTHTTVLSAQMLHKIAQLKDKKGKYFAIGKCFRNETVDWGHLFEFNQTEGIVIDKDANFRNLLGYLHEFFSKMGFDKVKFYPAYFPYTEPSVEIYGYNKERKVWMEIGGAGIFRPEVVVPLLGEYIPVLAWGPGFDRSIMEYYNIKDLRELYKNDIRQLRKIKFWMKS